MAGFSVATRAPGAAPRSLRDSAPYVSRRRLASGRVSPAPAPYLAAVYEARQAGAGSAERSSRLGSLRPVCLMEQQPKPAILGAKISVRYRKCDELLGQSGSPLHKQIGNDLLIVAGQAHFHEYAGDQNGDYYETQRQP
jgi:hypothetical protein